MTYSHLNFIRFDLQDKQIFDKGSGGSEGSQPKDRPEGP